MIRRQTPTRRRRGHSMVEFALVGPLVFILIIGCLEWCLYLFTLNQVQNAAREGSRYCATRTDTYQVFPGARTYLNQNPPDSYDAGVYTVAQVNTLIQNYLAGSGAQISNLKITVFKVNSSGQPIDLNGNVIAAPLTYDDATNQGQWNQTSFGQLIAVEITGSYIPLIPGLSQIGLSAPVSATAAMGSEGN